MEPLASLRRRTGGRSNDFVRASPSAQVVFRFD